MHTTFASAYSAENIALGRKSRSKFWSYSFFDGTGHRDPGPKDEYSVRTKDTCTGMFTTCIVSSQEIGWRVRVCSLHGRCLH